MIRWPFVHRQKCTQRHVLRWANFGPLAYDTDHDEAHKSGKFVAFDGSKLFEFQVISTGMTSWHRRVSDWNVTAVLMMSLEVINATFATASILWLVFRLVDWLFQVAGLDCLLYICCMKDLQKGGHWLWLSTNLVHSNFLSSPLWSIAEHRDHDGSLCLLQILARCYISLIQVDYKLTKLLLQARCRSSNYEKQWCSKTAA